MRHDIICYSEVCDHKSHERCGNRCKDQRLGVSGKTNFRCLPSNVAGCSFLCCQAVKSLTHLSSDNDATPQRNLSDGMTTKLQMGTDAVFESAVYL